MLLDFFCIFSTGGLILWYKQFVQTRLDTFLNYLIKSILLNQKRNLDYCVEKGTVLRWKIADEQGLIFVAAYQESYSVLYVDKLVEMVMTDFVKSIYPSLPREGTVILDNTNYSQQFMEILGIWENSCNKLLEGGEQNKKSKELFKKGKADRKSKINSEQRAKSEENKEENLFEEAEKENPVSGPQPIQLNSNSKNN